MLIDEYYYCAIFRLLTYEWGRSQWSRPSLRTPNTVNSVGTRGSRSSSRRTSSSTGTAPWTSSSAPPNCLSKSGQSSDTGYLMNMVLPETFSIPTFTKCKANIFQQEPPTSLWRGLGSVKMETQSVRIQALVSATLVPRVRMMRSRVHLGSCPTWHVWTRGVAEMISRLPRPQPNTTSCVAAGPQQRSSPNIQTLQTDLVEWRSCSWVWCLHSTLSGSLLPDTCYW